MSDDEVGQPGMGDMAGMDDDMSDDMEEPPMPEALPEGVKKEVVKEGEGWQKPKAGDEVTVHYVGTLESDGTQFDSSRDRGKPFNFTLGKGQVIKGWDTGVAAMKKGELAKLTLAPEFAYGESGSPPKIPANATLVFEVELLSWVSKNDLFSDGGCIKSILQEGSGWKSPKPGDEVRIDYKVLGEKGEKTIQDKENFEYVVGSDVLGSYAQAIDRALKDMKKGEQVSLACNAEYGGGEDIEVTMTLSQIYESKDVSLAKDKSLMKKQVVEGEGWDSPKEAAKITLQVESATDGTKEISGFSAKSLEFIAGNGEVCDALEYAVLEMKLQEKAVLTCTNPLLAAEAQLGLKDVSGDKVVFTLVLTDFEKAKDTWNMSEEEKLAFGSQRKDVGGALFKAGRWRLALERYKKVINLFSYLDSIKDEDNKSKAKELKKACELNSAACNLKFKEFAEARKNCDNVLKEDSSNVKALFRRAQSRLGDKNFMECMADLKKVVELDPQNREARTLMKEAQAGQKEEDKKSKGLFAKMCQGLGKGPIPEPGKAKSFVPEDDDDDEEPEEDKAA
jgi:FK506-binding protein 4/5